jgi:ATP/maltotriose-dependent transcriptional regulator MalT
VSEVLLGRAAEAEALGRLVDAAAAGAGGVGIVHGPAGIGKSTLLASLQRRAAAAGFAVAAGGGDELDQVSWLGPLLRSLRSSTPPVLLADDLHELGEMGQLMVTLDRLRDLIEVEAMRRPLLISIDDLQWADEGTLIAMATLPPTLFAVPVVWILAHRPVPSSRALELATDRLRRAGASVVELDRLGDDVITDLVTGLTGAPPGPTFLNLLAQAQGNPFYVIELTQALVADGRVEVRGDRSWVRGRELPAEFRSAIRPHVRALSPGCRRLLEVGAVLGHTFRLADVLSVLGRSIAELWPAVEDATRATVLVDDADDQLSFRHDLLRTAIYDEIPGGVRRTLHRDAVTALMATGADAARMAPHVARSAERGDERAISILGEAAMALSGRNPTTAAELARRAFELLPEDDPRRPRAALFAAELLSWAGRFTDARRLVGPFLGTVDTSLEAKLQLALLRSAVLGTGQDPELPDIERTRLHEADVSTDDRARYLLMRGASLRYRDPAAAVTDVRLGVADVAVTGSRSAALFAEIVEAQFALGAGDASSAVAHAKRAVAIADAGDESLRGSVPRTELGQALHADDHLDEALDVLASSFRDAQLYRFHFLALGEANRAAVLLSLGRIDDAVAEAESAMAHADTPPFALAWSRAARVLVEAAVRRDDHATADAHVRRINAHVGAGGVWPGDRWAAAAFAEATHGPAAALAAIAVGVDDLADGWCWLVIPEVERLPTLVAWAIASRRSDMVETVLAAARRLFARNPHHTALAGAVAHAQGLAGAEPAELERAIGCFENASRPLAAAAAAEALADWFDEQRKTADALDHLQFAFDQLDRSGATRDLARVRARLRAHGVHRRHRGTHRPSSGWEGLTDSERTVVGLVVDGLTSREVAERLFLSVNTVNTHLGHAFTKLGVRSRHELIRLALAGRQPTERWAKPTLDPP